MFVYELNGSGFKSRCCHINMFFNKMPGNIADDIEISSDSHREDSDRENSNEENFNEKS